MKIMTNTVGNYTPHINNNSVQKTKLPPKGVDRAEALNTKPKSGDLTADEKKFFMDMYPQNKSEVTDYHFYRKNGEMSGVQVGSLFDRRG